MEKRETSQKPQDTKSEAHEIYQESPVIFFRRVSEVAGSVRYGI